MKRAMVIPLLLLLTIGCAKAGAQEPAPATLPETTPDSPGTLAKPAAGNASAESIDALLDALDERGKTLKDLQGKVALTETDTATGDGYTKHGTIALENPGNGSTRARITFTLTDYGGDNLRKQTTEYLFEGIYLIDRNYTKKQEVKRQIRQPGDEIDLVKLGEGPFPLPIGQSKEDVHQQFDVTLIETEPEGVVPPPGTTHLQLIPKPGTKLARKFTMIDVWVDPKLSMPVRISAEPTTGSSIQTTDLTDLKINEGVPDEAFKLPELGKDWSRVEEKFED